MIEGRKPTGCYNFPVRLSVRGKAVLFCGLKVALSRVQENAQSPGKNVGKY